MWKGWPWHSGSTRMNEQTVLFMPWEYALMVVPFKVLHGIILSTKVFLTYFTSEQSDKSLMKLFPVIY